MTLPYPWMLKKLLTHFCLEIEEGVLTVRELHQVREKQVEDIEWQQLYNLCFSRKKK